MLIIVMWSDKLSNDFNGVDLMSWAKMPTTYDFSLTMRLPDLII